MRIWPAFKDIKQTPLSEIGLTAIQAREGAKAADEAPIYAISFNIQVIIEKDYAADLNPTYGPLQKMTRKTLARTSPAVIQTARKNRQTPTPAEQRLWRAIRGGKLDGMKFRKQQPWGTYILDFFCLEKMIAIEVDGSIHDDPENKALDAEQTMQLSEAGIRVVRFSNEDVLNHLDTVLYRIRTCVDQLI